MLKQSFQQSPVQAAIRVETPAAWDGMRALARFLSKVDERDQDEVTISSKRWAREIMPGRDLDNRSVVRAMKETLRSLPYNEAGILERAIIDDGGTVWQIRTAKKAGHSWLVNARRIGSEPARGRIREWPEDHS